MCKLNKVKHEKPWMVQLSIGTKEKVLELVKECKIDLNGFPTNVYLNILPLVLYDILICMEWLEQHHVMVEFLNKSILSTNKQQNQRNI